MKKQQPLAQKNMILGLSALVLLYIGIESWFVTALINSSTINDSLSNSFESLGVRVTSFGITCNLFLYYFKKNDFDTAINKIHGSHLFIILSILGFAIWKSDFDFYLIGLYVVFFSIFIVFVNKFELEILLSLSLLANYFLAIAIVIFVILNFFLNR